MSYLDATIVIFSAFSAGLLLGNLAAYLRHRWDLLDAPTSEPAPDSENSQSMESGDVVVDLIISATSEEIALWHEPCAPEPLESLEQEPVTHFSDYKFFTEDTVQRCAAVLDALKPKTIEPYSHLTDDELREHAYSNGISKSCKKRSTLLAKLAELGNP